MMDPTDIPDNPALFAMKASEGTWKLFKHLALIIELLIYVVQGRCSRLMVFCPPRHGKSDSLVTISYPGTSDISQIKKLYLPHILQHLVGNGEEDVGTF